MQHRPQDQFLFLRMDRMSCRYPLKGKVRVLQKGHKKAKRLVPPLEMETVPERVKRRVLPRGMGRVP